MKIILDNVSKNIDGNEIIKNISMSFDSGSIYGLWGKNGSGKTMLMRMICGLVKSDTGEIKIDENVLGKDMDFLESVGVMLETPGFIEHYTAIENLMAIAYLKGKTDKKEIEELLSYMGLERAEKKKIKKYSLGMRQKVGIISALMENPDIIILDEPFNALDVESVSKVKVLLEEHKKRGALIIVSCHDKDEMNEIADEVYCLECGQLIGSYNTGQ